VMFYWRLKSKDFEPNDTFRQDQDQDKSQQFISDLNQCSSSLRLSRRQRILSDISWPNYLFLVVTSLHDFDHFTTCD